MPAGFVTKQIRDGLKVLFSGKFWDDGAGVLTPISRKDATQHAEVLATGATIGTRAYGEALARVAVGATSAYSAEITASEVLLHASTRCFIRVIAASGTPTITNSDIPLEYGEKFHLRLTSGQRIGVIRDTSDGFLNIVPVA